MVRGMLETDIMPMLQVGEVTLFIVKVFERRAIVALADMVIEPTALYKYHAQAPPRVREVNVCVVCDISIRLLSERAKGSEECITLSGIVVYRNWRLTPSVHGSVVRQSTTSFPLNCVPSVLNVAVALPAEFAFAVILTTSRTVPPPGTLHSSM